jgi:hypothetical protein
VRVAPPSRLGIWIAAVLALAVTLFVVPWSCWEAVVGEGSGAPTEGCDGILGFNTPFFTSAAPLVTLASMAITVILPFVAIRGSVRRRSTALAP